MQKKQALKEAIIVSSITAALFLLTVSTFAQNNVPSSEIIETSKLQDYLKKKVKTELNLHGEITEAILAEYFRGKFADRFFYDWHTVDYRFDEYALQYNNEDAHKNRAADHMQKFSANTPWILPFDYKNGEPVNSYALRHLARQHKMMDIAYLYFHEEKDPQYIQYFIEQMHSLNDALVNNTYEKIEDGNGVYEAFRSGYRVLNWLSIHNMFLGEPAYTDQDQLYTIATLLQHGAHLYGNNNKFKSGNHQTRGLSALAMISILLQDFEETDKWFDRSMTLLQEHLMQEINEDGFQFERSVHYHMSDISNFFYVYQLAKISQIPVNELWTNKLESLFTTLTKIAYPDKSTPVLQDDTDNPWAEKNDVAGTMTLGYLLFTDPEFGYFAEDHVDAKMYWFLNQNQLSSLKNIKKEKPNHGSLSFPNTKYYIMRNGWNKEDHMMIISAGLDDRKPDHQHGDMLGIQAMANGKVILPNYQVRYSLSDYEFFKNSMVKNVALVDNELQGKEYKGNKGGSGFGKFKNLPNPTTIAWENNTHYDFFAGSHDGFENINVNYSRQVIYIKNDFWIVKDNFESAEKHEYKQVWQGHYTNEEQPNLIRSVFDDASGCDIFQLQNTDTVIKDGLRGKEWSIVQKNEATNFSFITIVYPYHGYSNRINENEESSKINDWKINKLTFDAKGEKLISLSKENEAYLFNISHIEINEISIVFSTPTDVFIEFSENDIQLNSLGKDEAPVKIDGAYIVTKGETEIEQESIMRPGERIQIRIAK